MSRIIVADISSVCDAGKSTGHYFAVAQNYVDMFRQSDKVIVAGGPIYRQKFADNLLMLPYNHVIGESKLQEKWHELMNCRALCKQVRREDILVMQSIALATAFVGIILFLRQPCSLFFIQYNTESLSNRLKRFLWRLVWPKVQGIIASFPSVAQAYKKPYICVPDYVYVNNQPTSFPSFDEREYDICMLGHIYRDKGMVEALTYFIGKGLKIVVAGKIGDLDIEPEIIALAQMDENVELHIGYIDEKVYHKYLSHSKFCVLNYRGQYNEHSSGVVYDALFHGTPVLAADIASTQMVKEYGCGVSFDDVCKIDIQKLKDAVFYAECQMNIERYLQKQQIVIGHFSDFLHGRFQ